MRFVWVGAAGALGSVLRYVIGLALGASAFPWGTLTVNLAGSFLIGLVFALGEGRVVPQELVVPLTVGFLGGFTTFSAFAWEGVSMAGKGRYGALAVYVAVSVVGGFAAAVLGRLAGTTIR
ncbi:MAG: CrcB family protein [Actinomycetes bacterium]|jgi:CrcB protein|nr:MAG: hypothetical protein DIU67_04825 [Actinomycetota bacterium]